MPSGPSAILFILVVPVAELMPQPRRAVVAAAAMRFTRTLLSLSRLALRTRGVAACGRGPWSVRCRRKAGRGGAAGGWGERGSSYMAVWRVSGWAGGETWGESRGQSDAASELLGVGIALCG